MKKIVIILIFSLLSFDGTACIKENNETGSMVSLLCNPTSSISIKYLRSILAGTLVGAGTGMVSAYCDTVVPPFWPITWFASMNARCDLVSSLGKDMTQNDIPYHDGLMRLSSLVATWIAWYKTFNVLNGHAPF